VLGKCAGTSLSASRVLMLLREGPCKMCEVASYLGSSSAAVTGLVDELSKRGKVERSPL